MIPLIIFVETLRAWKNLISEGSSPVGPFFTITSIGAY